MRSSGGIGDMMLKMSWISGNYVRYFIIYFYNISCFVIINIILMNLIFGIIIDTFKELRERKMQMEENQKNVCFICSMERPVFDKTQVHGLEIHMQLDHN